jgi:hypothetical protein
MNRLPAMMTLLLLAHAAAAAAATVKAAVTIPTSISPPARRRMMMMVSCRPSDDDANATATCLQAAFDAALPGDVIEVPFTGKPWVVSRPLNLRRDGVTLHFLPGVVLEAQRGQFHGESDCLLTVGGATTVVVGVTVRGSPGALLRMHRAEYANSTLYSKAEWRHGLQLVSVRDTLIEGLRIELSGGDGIYVDQATNTTIRDVDMANNYRQGMSVVAADGLLVEDCLMHGTDGTNPQAGLDIEPNRPQDELVNITFSRCTSYNNTGNQIDVFPTCLRYRVCGQAERVGAVKPGQPPRHDLRSPTRRAELVAGNILQPQVTPQPMSILFEECAVSSFASFNGSDNGCGGSLGCGDGLIMSGVFTPGNITVKKFRAVRNGGSGISIGKAAGVGAATILIQNSTLEANNPDEHEWRGVQDAEIHLLSLIPSEAPNVTQYGEVTLSNLRVNLASQLAHNKSWCTTVGGGTITGINGDVTIHSTIGCPLLPASFGVGATGIDVKVTCVPTNPPPCGNASWWWVSANGDQCFQKCPSSNQGRGTSGRCLCGGAAPDNACIAGLHCVSGECQPVVPIG